MLACKKSEPISPGLFGKWELRSMVGGFVGFDSTYKAGNGRVFQFNSDSTYKKFNKGTLVAQGIFHIRSHNPSSGTSFSEIFFDDHINSELFNMDGTNLTIGENANDGIQSSYRKIQNK